MLVWVMLLWDVMVLLVCSTTMLRQACNADRHLRCPNNEISSTSRRTTLLHLHLLHDDSVTAETRCPPAAPSTTTLLQLLLPVVIMMVLLLRRRLVVLAVPVELVPLPLVRN
jgi:hypothetical protein